MTFRNLRAPPPAELSSLFRSLCSFTECVCASGSLRFVLSDSPPTRSRREEAARTPSWKRQADMTPCLRLSAHILRAFYARKIGFGGAARSLCVSYSLLRSDTQITSACPDRVRVPSGSPLLCLFSLRVWM